MYCNIETQSQGPLFETTYNPLNNQFSTKEAVQKTDNN
jgi:hypothetical protein